MSKISSYEEFLQGLQKGDCEAWLILQVQHQFFQCAKSDLFTGQGLNSDLLSCLDALNSAGAKVDKDRLSRIDQHVHEALYHLFNEPHLTLKREHIMLPFRQVREFDNASISWLAKRPGLNFQQKLALSPTIKALNKRWVLDTAENQLLKAFAQQYSELLELKHTCLSQAYDESRMTAEHAAAHTAESKTDSENGTENQSANQAANEAANQVTHEDKNPINNIAENQATQKSDTYAENVSVNYAQPKNDPSPTLQSENELLELIERWLEQDEVREIRPWRNLQPNNTLLSSKYYRRIWDAWTWLKNLDEDIFHDWAGLPQMQVGFLMLQCASLFNALPNLHWVQIPCLFHMRSLHITWLDNTAPFTIRPELSTHTQLDVIPETSEMLGLFDGKVLRLSCSNTPQLSLKVEWDKLVISCQLQAPNHEHKLWQARLQAQRDGHLLDTPELSELTHSPSLKDYLRLVLNTLVHNSQDSQDSQNSEITQDPDESQPQQALELAPASAPIPQSAFEPESETKANVQAMDNLSSLDKGELGSLTVTANATPSLDSNSESEIEIAAESQAQETGESEVDAEAKAGTKVESESESKTEVEAKSESKTDVEAKAESESESKVNTKTIETNETIVDEPEDNAETEVKSELANQKTEAKIDASSELETQPQFEAKALTKTAPDALMQAKMPPESKEDSQAEASPATVQPTLDGSSAPVNEFLSVELIGLHMAYASAQAANEKQHTAFKALAQVWPVNAESSSNGSVKEELLVDCARALALRGDKDKPLITWHSIYQHESKPEHLVNALTCFFEHLANEHPTNCLWGLVPDSVPDLALTDLRRQMFLQFRKSQTLPRSIGAAFDFSQRHQPPSDAHPLVLLVLSLFGNYIEITPLVGFEQKQLLKVAPLSQGWLWERHPTQVYSLSQLGFSLDATAIADSTLNSKSDSAAKSDSVSDSISSTISSSIPGFGAKSNSGSGSSSGLDAIPASTLAPASKFQVFPESDELINTFGLEEIALQSDNLELIARTPAGAAIQSQDTLSKTGVNHAPDMAYVKSLRKTQDKAKAKAPTNTLDETEVHQVELVPLDLNPGQLADWHVLTWPKVSGPLNLPLLKDKLNEIFRQKTQQYRLLRATCGVLRCSSLLPEIDKLADLQVTDFGLACAVSGAQFLHSLQLAAPQSIFWKDFLPELKLRVQGKDYQLVRYQQIVPVFNQAVAIPISNNVKLTLPANCQKYHFKLLRTQDAHWLKFMATISSPKFPLSKDLECSLELTYIYGAEEPYRLTFKPQTEIKALPVTWELLSNLPMHWPNYPEPKAWSQVPTNSVLYCIEALQKLTASDANFKDKDIVQNARFKLLNCLSEGRHLTLDCNNQLLKQVQKLVNLASILLTANPNGFIKSNTLKVLSALNDDLPGNLMQAFVDEMRRLLQWFKLLSQQCVGATPEAKLEDKIQDKTEVKHEDKTKVKSEDKPQDKPFSKLNAPAFWDMLAFSDVVGYVVGSADTLPGGISQAAHKRREVFELILQCLELAFTVLTKTGIPKESASFEYGMALITTNLLRSANLALWRTEHLVARLSRKQVLMLSNLLSLFLIKVLLPNFEGMMAQDQPQKTKYPGQSHAKASAKNSGFSIQGNKLLCTCLELLLCLLRTRSVPALADIWAADSELIDRMECPMFQLKDKFLHYQRRHAEPIKLRSYLELKVDGQSAMADEDELPLLLRGAQIYLCGEESSFQIKVDGLQDS